MLEIMKINVVINKSNLIRFVSNLSCSVYIVLDIPLHISPLNCSHFLVDQWFNNLIRRGHILERKVQVGIKEVC